ncbi:hypothetical protein GGI24_005100 [Coemansia furcata]|nr:hypothetical protein GGI24_005100 [Coemansia furcata]
MNDSSAQQQPPAPINISRTSALSMAQQPLSGSAASFGTDYERGGLANSFQQMQQQHQFHHQQQQHSHNLFRAHLGSPVQQDMFSPDPDNLSEISPQSSFQQHHSLAAMASGALPTSIPGAFLAGAQRPGAHMLRMPAFSGSPAMSPTFQSMSLPAHSDIFGSHLGHHQGLDSALDSSSFNAQYLGGGNPVDFSPQNQTLMSLMEGDDGETSQKSAIINYEKRRRRRESHNAVERRRRDNINVRIQDLYALLPDMMIDPNTKPNKGVILKKSVEYIRQLQAMIQSQGQRIRELESGGMASGIPPPPQQQQSSSGLAAMLAGAAGLGSQRAQGGDVNMMNSGL